MLDLAWQATAGGAAIVDSFAHDDVVGGLLLLHGLHPLDLKTRVSQALDKVRPYLRSHGGNVELLRIDPDGVVRLRMQGSCHGCPSSAMTLKLAIEEAIYEQAPDVMAIEVEGADDRTNGLLPTFVPVGQLRGTISPPSCLATPLEYTDEPRSRLRGPDAGPVRRPPQPDPPTASRGALRTLRRNAGARAHAPGGAGQPPAALLLRRLRDPLQRPEQ